MDTILKKNVKAVHKLNAQAERGSLKSFTLQLEIGKICAEGYAYWKANKKELKMNREDLLNAYGYGKTYFGELRKSADVSPEDVGRYIDSMKEPTYSIKGLLKFLQPEKEDKPKTLFQFQSFEDKSRLTIDENYNLEIKGMEEAQMLGILNFVQEQLANKLGLATIKLEEVEA